MGSGGDNTGDFLVYISMGRGAGMLCHFLGFEVNHPFSNFKNRATSTRSLNFSGSRLTDMLIQRLISSGCPAGIVLSTSGSPDT